ncbi:MAG: Type 1 glutamine amidotransferase-like domain-containing protein [Solirubrobacterales bacterium]
MERIPPTHGGRILAIGGHEFTSRDGNGAICDLIVELADSAHPRICLLPTASGDPADQIAGFRRAFGERGCDPSAISLFRLGTESVDVRAHLLAQDAIYVGGGSMVNLLAIWRAHGLEQVMRECLRAEILVCGQSAGAMCWFEGGITRSTGRPEPAAGLGLLAGSACVHYDSERDRRERFIDAVREGELPPGLGIEDQTAALFEEGSLIETIVARDGAAVRQASPYSETRLRSRAIRAAAPAIDALAPEVLELRRTLASRGARRRSRRSRVGRLD